MTQEEFVRFVLMYIQKHGDTIDQQKASTFLANVSDAEHQYMTRGEPHGANPYDSPTHALPGGTAAHDPFAHALPGGAIPHDQSTRVLPGTTIAQPFPHNEVPGKPGELPVGTISHPLPLNEVPVKEVKGVPGKPA
jgi:hypothetical protein